MRGLGRRILAERRVCRKSEASAGEIWVARAGTAEKTPLASCLGARLCPALYTDIILRTMKPAKGLAEGDGSEECAMIR